MALYGGSPIALIAALAALEVIGEENLIVRANVIGDRLRDRISDFAVRIVGLRGPGAMIAFEIDDANGHPDGIEATKVCARALDAGLILLSAVSSAKRSAP